MLNTCDSKDKKKLEEIIKLDGYKKGVSEKHYSLQVFPTERNTETANYTENAIIRNLLLLSFLS